MARQEHLKVNHLAIYRRHEPLDCSRRTGDVRVMMLLVREQRHQQCDGERAEARGSVSLHLPSLDDGAPCEERRYSDRVRQEREKQSATDGVNATTSDESLAYATNGGYVHANEDSLSHADCERDGLGDAGA